MLIPPLPPDFAEASKQQGARHPARKPAPRLSSGYSNREGAQSLGCSLLPGVCIPVGASPESPGRRLPGICIPVAAELLPAAGQPPVSLDWSMREDPDWYRNGAMDRSATARRKDRKGGFGANRWERRSTPAANFNRVFPTAKVRDSVSVLQIPYHQV
jgi:hypothetical protein